MTVLLSPTIPIGWRLQRIADTLQRAGAEQLAQREQHCAHREDPDACQHLVQPVRGYGHRHDSIGDRGHGARS